MEMNRRVMEGFKLKEVILIVQSLPMCVTVDDFLLLLME